MAIIEHAGYYEDPMPGVSHEHFCCELMYITEEDTGILWIDADPDKERGEGLTVESSEKP